MHRSSKLLNLRVVWRITIPHLQLVAKGKVVLHELHAFKLGIILGTTATVKEGTSIQLMLHDQYLGSLISPPPDLGQQSLLSCFPVKKLWLRELL